MNRATAFGVATCVATFVVSAGCSCGKATEPPKPAPSAAASAGPPPAASLVNVVPIASAEVAAAVNPNSEPPYSGPTGSVRGTVVAKGDVPPILPEVVEKIPDACKDARLVYGRLFREGMMRSLGDVLVTATGYKGYVPAKGEAVALEAKGCSWGSRTLAVAFGQRLDVQSKDKEAYMPQLLGGKRKATMVAVPGGGPVKVYPHKPGRFTLVDSMRLYMTADVFVLKYPTFDVTGLDGKFEITGIPVGEVQISAMLPATMQHVSKTVKIEEGKTVELEFEIPFDKKTMLPEPPKSDGGTQIR